jgi:hypothetical protein
VPAHRAGRERLRHYPLSCSSGSRSVHRTVEKHCWVTTIAFRVWDQLGTIWSADQILVGLRIDGTQDPDQWAKEITAWTTCQCTVQTDHVETASSDPRLRLQLDADRQATVDTLAFRKAVFLGWGACGYFGPTPDLFWNLLGGLTLTFDSISDGGIPLGR